MKTPLLDNLGMTIRISDLAKYTTYRHWQNRYYGTGFCSRLWAQKIRPWLMPKRHAEIEQRYQNAKSAMHQSYLNAILEKMDDERKTD